MTLYMDWSYATVQRVAAAVHDELGDWMLSELNKQGLIDAIWDLYIPFAAMDSAEREAFYEAVYKELYG